MIKVNEQYIEVSLTKITFTFNKKWYDKYDIFKYNNQEYMCMSRPKKNEDNTWIIDILPTNNNGIKLNPDTEFIANHMSELYQ